MATPLAYAATRRAGFPADAWATKQPYRNDVSNSRHHMPPFNPARLTVSVMESLFNRSVAFPARLFLRGMAYPKADLFERLDLAGSSRPTALGERPVTAGLPTFAMSPVTVLPWPSRSGHHGQPLPTVVTRRSTTAPEKTAHQMI